MPVDDIGRRRIRLDATLRAVLDTPSPADAVESVARRRGLAYDGRMTFPSPRTSRRLATAIALSSLAVSSAATAAVTRKPTSRASTSVKANDSIIPLPLNPLVPAAQRVCAARTPSGLGYTMLRAASGTKPGEGDVVLVNYIGYLATTGAVFDQGMRSPLSLDGVIPGFAQGIRLIARTGVVRLCIPAALGYGAQASGPIPANADLVFQVELVDYKTATEVEAMNKAETGAAAAQKDPAARP